MTIDKRNVTTDALEVLGTIIDDSVGRDAIHLAVEPVIAGESLLRGQRIGLIDGLAYNDDHESIKPLGIVDPFLEREVQEGERFFMVIYPRQITSLRHVWTHPEFPETAVTAITLDKKGKSKKWLQDFADKTYNNFYTMMSDIENQLGSEYIVLKDGSYCNVSDEFWDHYAIYTGIIVPQEKRVSTFYCVC